MIVKPLSRFGKRGYLMWLALPDANHRDNQKNKGSYAEQRAAEPAPRDCADRAEEGVDDQESDVKGNTLGCMKTNLAFFARHEKQFDQCHYEPDVIRRVNQHRSPLLRNADSEHRSR